MNIRTATLQDIDQIAAVEKADAVLEFPAWTSENVEKMLKILGKEGE